MNSIRNTLAEAVRYSRTRGDQILAEDLEAAGRKIAAVLQAGDDLIEGASPHPSNSELYCVPVDCFDRLSAAHVAAGGA